jgi:superfamily I DNA/RNA helicase
VGDDWQAIYGFSGASNIFLTRNQDYFEHVKINILKKNYRNPTSILAYGQTMIQKTTDFIEKSFQPTNPIQTDCIYIKRIHAQSSQIFKAEQTMQAKALIKHLLSVEKIKAHEIMVLSRFNRGLLDITQACEEDPTIPTELRKKGEIVKEGVRFLTVHRSKGLESDVIILLNMRKGSYGFPSELTSKINYAFLNDNISSRIDEEVRLFFVALTRARKRIYIFTHIDHESEFLPEKPDSSKTLSKLKETSRINGKILKTTEKAILIEIEAKYNEGVDFWIPKSVILSQYDENFVGVQEIVLQNWWIQKKFVEESP